MGRRTITSLLSLIILVGTSLLIVRALGQGTPDVASAPLRLEDLRPGQDGHRPAEAEEYVHTLSDKMRYFRLLREQIEVVVLGDSRTDAGVDPSALLQNGNVEIPKSFNLATGSCGLRLNALLTEEYLVHLPRLRWVVYGISPRIFNEAFHDGRADQIVESPGYYYDRKFDALVWEPIPATPIRVSDLDSASVTAWGWIGDQTPPPEKWVWYNNFTDPNVVEQQIELATRPRKAFAIGPEKWERFLSIVELLTGRGVRVLAFIPPMHRYVADLPVADDDGTSDSGYWELVRRMESMDREQTGFFFVDVHRDGRNPFEDEHFFNFDHLNGEGAKKLTRFLDDALRQADGS